MQERERESERKEMKITQREKLVLNAHIVKIVGYFKCVVVGVPCPRGGLEANARV